MSKKSKPVCLCWPSRFNSEPAICIFWGVKRVTPLNIADITAKRLSDKRLSQTPVPTTHLGGGRAGIQLTIQTASGERYTSTYCAVMKLLPLLLWQLSMFFCPNRTGRPSRYLPLYQFFLDWGCGWSLVLHFLFSQTEWVTMVLNWTGYFATVSTPIAPIYVLEFLQMFWHCRGHAQSLICTMAIPPQ